MNNDLQEKTNELRSMIQKMDGIHEEFKDILDFFLCVLGTGLPIRSTLDYMKNYIDKKEEEKNLRNRIISSIPEFKYKGECGDSH